MKQLARIEVTDAERAALDGGAAAAMAVMGRFLAANPGEALAVSFTNRWNEAAGWSARVPFAPGLEGAGGTLGEALDELFALTDAGRLRDQAAAMRSAAEALEAEAEALEAAGPGVNAVAGTGSADSKN